MEEYIWIERNKKKNTEKFLEEVRKVASND